MSVTDSRSGEPVDICLRCQSTLPLAAATHLRPEQHKVYTSSASLYTPRQQQLV